MLKIPSLLWTYLLSQRFDSTTVYEIEPIDRLGAVETVGNNGFEVIVGGNPLDFAGWTEFPGTGTIRQDPFNANPFLSSSNTCRFDNPGAATLRIERYDIHLTPGKWYLCETYIAGGVAKTLGFALRIVNLTAVRELKSDLTWSAGNTGLLCQNENVTTTWRRVSFWFQAEATAGAADNYAVSLQQYNGGAPWSAGQQMWVDDHSIRGPYERPGLLFGSSDVIWHGNAYTGLAVSCREVHQEKQFRVPDVSVTFSNVANLLRQYVVPTDLLTGARLTIRLLLKDPTGAPFQPTSAAVMNCLVLFSGRVERPKRITETEFDMVARGLIDGNGSDTPVRRTGSTCGWDFANAGRFDGAGHCSYQQTTTAVGAGANTTALTIAAASNFANGDVIQVGGTTAVAIASGAGTTSLTLAEARTWSNGAGVRYATCPFRTPGECFNRGMLHRFGGHPGIAQLSRLGQTLAAYRAPLTTQARQRHGGPSTVILPVALNATDDFLASPNGPVPVLYGRRLIAPKIAELVEAQAPFFTDVLYRAAFYTISVGTIEQVRRYFIDRMLGAQTYRTVGPNTDLLDGIYYRVGGVGLLDSETKAEYIADPTSLVRSQNIDYRSFAGVAYSEEAYVILLTWRPLAAPGAQNTTRKLESPNATFDVLGVKVQAYNADGTAAGARAWSASPIWQCVDWYTADYALDNAVTDCDMLVNKAEADHAAVLITSTEASTTVAVNSASSTTCQVLSTEGFVVGRRVDVNGVANTVDYVYSDTVLILGTAVAQTAGQTVVQRPQRFESHLYIDTVGRGSRWIENLLASCRGYVTYDNGKAQFRIERAHVTDAIGNGLLDTWASPSDAGSWTEVAVGGSTIAQESTIVHTAGGSAAKLTQVAGGDCWLEQTTTLEPGRWYRLALWGCVGTVGKKVRAVVRNVTQNKGMQTDGLTWTSANVYCIDSTGLPASAANYRLKEITFLVDPTFGAADSYKLFIASTENAAVYFDDVTLRGPYAGDFRESTGALVSGIREGSFLWALDDRDNETNRVAVRFTNESGFQGSDEAVANDFTHQRFFPVKTLTVEAPGVVDRDQAMRLAQFHLDKIRTTEPGCEFVASPAALAVQPGDVILVSHTIPNWTTEEQRVISTDVIGLGDADELFVKLKTEDYIEALYTDVGPKSLRLGAARPSVTITVSVDRNAGGILDLSWYADNPIIAVGRFRLHSSPSSGFTPDSTNVIAETSIPSISYTVPRAHLEQVRYYRVVAVSDYGAIMSGEQAIIVYATDPEHTDGTQAENDAEGNMVYDSDANGTEFQLNADPVVNEANKASDGWVGNTNATYLRNVPNGTPAHLTPSQAMASGGGTDNAFTNPANAYDGVGTDPATSPNTGTSATGAATWNPASPAAQNVASMRLNFAAGTKTGRGRISGFASGTNFGSIDLRFSLDGGANWVIYTSTTNTSPGNYYTPRLVNVNMANFKLEVVVKPRYSGLISNTTTWNWTEGSFEEESAGSVIAHIVNGRFELKGDGTNYAELRRRFPGKAPPPSGLYLTQLTPNRWEIKAQRLGSVAPTNPLDIRIEDTQTGRTWDIASIPGATIEAQPNWGVYMQWFTPGIFPIAGKLDIVLRTKDVNGIRCDQVAIKRESVATSYQVHSEDQQLGRFPDRSVGEAHNWPKGRFNPGGAIRKVIAT